MLHSGYSNIRLESYLFTKQAMDDVRKRLQPGGMFVMYNYFRQGWIVSRLQNSVRAAFGNDALVLNLPSRDRLDPDDNLGGDFTMLLAGDNRADPRRVRAAARVLAAAARAVRPRNARTASTIRCPASAQRWRAMPAPSTRQERVAAVQADAGECRHGDTLRWRPTTGRCSTCASR